MGCNQPGVIPDKDADRIALLTDFAAAMKEKLDKKDEKYPPGTPYSLVDLISHLDEEYEELVDANKMVIAPYLFNKPKPKVDALQALEAECIDVANMAFLIREECIRLRGVNNGPP